MSLCREECSFIREGCPFLKFSLDKKILLSIISIIIIVHVLYSLRGDILPTPMHGTLYPNERTFCLNEGTFFHSIMQFNYKPNVDILTKRISYILRTYPIVTSYTQHSFTQPHYTLHCLNLVSFRVDLP